MKKKCLHSEDVLIFTKGGQNCVFCSFYMPQSPKSTLLNTFFLLRKGQITRFFCRSEIPYNKDEKSISLAQSKPQNYIDHF